MMWLEKGLVIKARYFKQDSRTGRFSASASVSEKMRDGTREWHNIPVNFSTVASAKLMSLIKKPDDAMDINVLSGAVRLYDSTTYKTEKGRPITLCSLWINDLELKVWDNDNNNTPGRAEQAHARKPVYPNEAPLPWEDNNAAANNGNDQLDPFV